MDRDINKRRAKRITAGYRAEVVYENNSYPGVIENLSALGANVLTDPLGPDIEFVPDTAIELKFETPTGETIIIKCMIMWSSKIPPHNIRHRIGMEIHDLPWDKVGMFL